MYHQIPLILGEKKDFLKIGIHFQQFPFVSSWRPNNIIFKIIFTDLATLKGKPSGETALMHPLADAERRSNSVSQEFSDFEGQALRLFSHTYKGS